MVQTRLPFRHFRSFPLGPSRICQQRQKTFSSSYYLQMSSWSCKRCTFLNPPSQNSSCQVCLSSSSPPPSSSAGPKWSCEACTFLNSYSNSECEICGTRVPISTISSFDDLKNTSADGDLDSSVGSVFFPLQLCGKRKLRDDPQSFGIEDVCVESDGLQGKMASTKPVDDLEDTRSGAALTSLKILSYNVWFREDLEMHKRMKALGELIQLHSPDLICLQEVTPNIFDIFKRSGWWKDYLCSVSNELAHSRPYFCMLLSKLPVRSFSRKPFVNSIMGRELCIAEVEVSKDVPLIIATSHLESPCPAPPKWDQMYSKERVDQANEAVNSLNKNANVIFGGDMNWDDKMDGQFPLLEGWIDAWKELKPRENGWTYDTKSNQMLAGNRTLQKRLDRFICSLRDFKTSSIEMIGKNSIPGLSYTKEQKARNEIKKLELPVLPSDHYGLLLTICRR